MTAALNVAQQISKADKWTAEVVQPDCMDPLLMPHWHTSMPWQWWVSAFVTFNYHHPILDNPKLAIAILLCKLQPSWYAEDVLVQIRERKGLINPKAQRDDFGVEDKPKWHICVTGKMILWP